MLWLILPPLGNSGQEGWMLAGKVKRTTQYGAW